MKTVDAIVESLLGEAADPRKITSKMEKGQRVVVSDEGYDDLIAYLDKVDHPKASRLASLPNPRQIGTRDTLVAFFK